MQFSNGRFRHDNPSEIANELLYIRRIPKVKALSLTFFFFLLRSLDSHHFSTCIKTNEQDPRTDVYISNFYKMNQFFFSRCLERVC